MNEWLQAQIDRELIARGGLREFIKQAWPIIEPGRPYQHNWHIDYISEHLEAASNGQITRLLICQPPACGKSITIAVCWQPWEWTIKPWTKWLCGSHDYKISIRDNMRARNLIDSDWYQRTFGKVYERSDDNWQKLTFANSKGGFRSAISIDSNVVGQHGDRQVADDLVRTQDAHPGLLHIPALEKAWEWWSRTMPSRLTPSISSVRAMVMQRLHSNDPAARWMDADKNVVTLVLPMEYDPKRSQITVLGLADPRKEEGELLWPSLHTAEMVAEKKTELGANVYATQFQQSPSPAGGALFKRDWMRQYWKDLPSNIHMIQSWDTTFKGGETSDYVVGQVWGYAKGNYYFIDQVRAKMDVPAQLAAIIAFSAKPRNKKAHLKLIEEAASGAGLVAMLKEKGLSGVVAEPTNNKNKEIRAVSILPLWEAGNVYLPHPDIAPWIHDFIEELAVFPGGKNDDQVDAMTQALNKLRSGKAAIYIKAMDKFK